MYYSDCVEHNNNIIIIMNGLFEENYTIIYLHEYFDW